MALLRGLCGRPSRLVGSVSNMISIRTAAVPVRSRVEETHTVIRSYLENMDTLCSFESKALELNRLSQELDAGKLQETESNLIIKRHSNLQQQVCLSLISLFIGLVYHFPETSL